jgi:adenine phosphoribosyltransferase
MNLLDYLPVVPDFPKPGIMFRDISPLLANPRAFQEAINQLAVLTNDIQYTHILGIESRGFIFGAALANHLSKPLILARKPNKLPLEVHQESYGLEYGKDLLEMQKAIIPLGSRVLIVDDVLATGGTF